MSTISIRTWPGTGPTDWANWPLQANRECSKLANIWANGIPSCWLVPLVMCTFEVQARIDVWKVPHWFCPACSHHKTDGFGSLPAWVKYGNHSPFRRSISIMMEWVQWIVSFLWFILKSISFCPIRCWIRFLLAKKQTTRWNNSTIHPRLTKTTPEVFR